MAIPANTVTEGSTCPCLQHLLFLQIPGPGDLEPEIVASADRGWGGGYLPFLLPSICDVVWFLIKVALIHHNARIHHRNPISASRSLVWMIALDCTPSGTRRRLLAELERRIFDNVVVNSISRSGGERCIIILGYCSNKMNACLSARLVFYKKTLIQHVLETAVIRSIQHVYGKSFSFINEHRLSILCCMMYTCTCAFLH